MQFLENNFYLSLCAKWDEKKVGFRYFLKILLITNELYIKRSVQNPSHLVYVSFKKRDFIICFFVLSTTYNLKFFIILLMINIL